VSRPALIALVGLASYAALCLALSAVVAIVWRSGAIDRRQTPVRRARQVTWLRALPGAGAAFLTLTIVAPAFAIFEPPGPHEVAGPIVLALAALAAVLFGVSIAAALRSGLATRSLVRQWLPTAAPLELDPPAGVRAYAIAAPAPLVALIGVFSPTLVAARMVLDACTPAELLTIVRHERGHLQARDNLKRWLMMAAPDPLRWTPVHEAMMAAWGDAAEDAADEAAAGHDNHARLALAALLVKIAGLGALPSDLLPAMSPFVQADDLERRVRRLIASPADQPPSWPSRLIPAAALLPLIAAAATLQSPAAMKAIYEAVEAVIVFGR
jgi:hypothetical protein